MGIEGNERADKLADLGKASAGKQGTTAPAQPRDHTALSFHGDIGMVLKEKAQEHFAPTGIVRRKPWITEATLTLLAEARAATAQDAEDAKLKRNQAQRVGAQRQNQLDSRPVSRGSGSFQFDGLVHGQKPKKRLQGAKNPLSGE